MDYEELIENIRVVGASLIDDNAPKCANICYDAATAIETLLAERERKLEEHYEKYKFTGKTKNVSGRTLKQIRAVRNFRDVRAGDIGVGSKKRKT